MAKTFCPVCRRTVDDIDAHIDESHSDPDAKVDGVPEADYIRDNISSAAATGDDDAPADVDATAVAVPSELDELGIKVDDLKNIRTTTRTGASLTVPEAKAVFTAIDELVNYRVHRAQFLVDFLDWGFRNSFSEELADAGGFSIVSDPTTPRRSNYYTVESLHTAINDHFAELGSGRTFTFRRLGRYLGRSIPVLVDNNENLRAFKAKGTPASNRLGVKPVHFLAVTSIFEYIKSFDKWSQDELRAHSAMVRSVLKQSSANNSEYMPRDLRPSPSQASTMADNGLNDFGVHQHILDREMGGRGKFDRGLYETLLKRASKGNPGRQGLGYSSD